MTDQQSDEFCFEKIKQGGYVRQLGVAQLYRKYAPMMRGYFCKNRLSIEEAEDVVQETFVNIVRSCDKFRGDCEIRMWLWTVARNCMLMHFRANKNDLESEYDDSIVNDSEHHEQTMDFASLEDCVQDAFLKFSEQFTERAEVLRLATIEGWSMKELSTFLSRTVGATREYVSQCRKYFRPFLELCRDYI